jgi:DNA polymerase V
VEYFALVDCDSFYVSCELMFQPWLRGRPVVVLSNNDGCAVSRSREAKRIGVPMGAPYFQFRKLLEQNNGLAFSSNYTLYADISARVMKVIREFSDSVEVYSIDEAFAVLERNRMVEDPFAAARRIWFNVRRFVGVPVSVGIAPTKTLAKIAGDRAKRSADGVVELTEPAVIDRILAETPVIDIWGINYRTAKKLIEVGIETAADLRDVPITFARKALTVVGARIVMELRGQSCLALEQVAPKKKRITRSRSFSSAVTELSEIKESIRNHVSHAAADMRHDRLVAQSITVFILTDKFRQDRPQYNPARQVRLATTTDSTSELLTVAIRTLEAIYRPGFEYRKAGIDLEALRPSEAESMRLFDNNHYERHKRLMGALDQINGKYGRDRLRFGLGTPHQQSWKMKRERLSPSYTTDFSDVLRVKI